eukprot:10938149-Alexandrium_andersonii.AAC.1
MSASLVGSEMCIRDRSAACCWPAAASPRKSSSQAGTSQTANKTHNPPTVSYTHLTLPTICSV